LKDKAGIKAAKQNVLDIFVEINVKGVNGTERICRLLFNTYTFE